MKFIWHGNESPKKKRRERDLKIYISQDECSEALVIQDDSGEKKELHGKKKKKGRICCTWSALCQQRLEIVLACYKVETLR